MDAKIYSPREILKFVDHTCLSPNAAWRDIKRLCDEAVIMQPFSVCIPPAYVKKAYYHLSGMMKISTVAGFPNGYNTTECKIYETADALKNGADEIDMVINLGWAKEGRYDKIKDEINEVKSICGDKILKVIIECCLFDREEKIRLCESVGSTNADYIKTSTGFSSGGALAEDIKLMSEHIPLEMKIKAAGGIRTLEDASLFLSLGADRLGSSKIIELIKETEDAQIMK